MHRQASLRRTGLVLALGVALPVACADENGSVADSEAKGDEAGTGDGDGDDPLAHCADAPITAPPTSLVEDYGLDPFYEQYLDAGGVPVVASSAPAPASLRVACEIAVMMLRERREVIDALAANRVRVGVMAQSEVTTDMPEHADLDTVFPEVDWDTRARGLGATLTRPLSSVGEENLLHLPGDPYDGESIMVHEFAHTFFDVGLAYVPGEAGVTAELDVLYQDALAAGTWDDTYAATNAQEYWAEAVQSWFDANLESVPADGVHGPVDTRREFQAADPAMASFIAEHMTADPWTVP